MLTAKDSSSGSQTSNLHSIAQLMETSGVGFGTSGARGRVEDMTDQICFAYTKAFLEQLIRSGVVETGCEVALAGDLRPSTPRILEAVAAAVQACDCREINCGFIPTPAVALYGFARGIPSIMVTGSHIPDDRNGIKFNKPDGEILKSDEAAIRASWVSLDPDLFDAAGARVGRLDLPPVDATAERDYIDRYLDFLPADALSGRRVGVYQHSGVARDILPDVLEGMGAEVILLGRSERFIPVDTEAVRPEDVELARSWTLEHGLDALVSTDGDGDRPLIADERGDWLRGDVVGVLCARFLGLSDVVTPVSSNTLVERSGWFERVLRTRIGSPFVVAAMEQALAEGRSVGGYEANGGFLLASRVTRGQRELAPLPTRDALIVVLAVLIQAGDQPLSRLLEHLPARYTCSDRIKDFPTALSARRIGELNCGDLTRDSEVFARLFPELDAVTAIDRTDGLRVTLASDEVVHLRPSGNAPELRCYTESGSESGAQKLNQYCMKCMLVWKDG